MRELLTVVIPAYNEEKMIAKTSSTITGILKDANIPYQFYTNRADIRGGSTLGNISNSHVSILSLDIGLAQLAMHSINETAGVKDNEYAIKAFEKFYSVSLVNENGEYSFNRP